MNMYIFYTKTGDFSLRSRPSVHQIVLGSSRARVGVAFLPPYPFPALPSPSTPSERDASLLSLLLVVVVIPFCGSKKGICSQERIRSPSSAVEGAGKSPKELEGVERGLLSVSPSSPDFHWQFQFPTSSPFRGVRERLWEGSR